jgi:hypothetical protein
MSDDIGGTYLTTGLNCCLALAGKFAHEIVLVVRANSVDDLVYH